MDQLAKAKANKALLTSQIEKNDFLKILNQTETNVLAMSLDISITFMFLNEAIIVSIECKDNDLKREKAGTIRAKINPILQNHKPPKETSPTMTLKS